MLLNLESEIHCLNQTLKTLSTCRSTLSTLKVCKMRALEDLTPEELNREACEAVGMKPHRDWTDESAAELPESPNPPLSLLPKGLQFDDCKWSDGVVDVCDGCGVTLSEDDSSCMRPSFGHDLWICCRCYVAHRGDIYYPVSTDPAACAKLKAAMADRYDRWPVVLRADPMPKYLGLYKVVIQKIVRFPLVAIESENYHTRWSFTGSRDRAVSADTEERAVALAVVAWSKNLDD